EAVSDMQDAPSSQRNMFVQRKLRECNLNDGAVVKACLAEAISGAKELARLFDVPLPEESEWDSLVDRIRDEAAPNEANVPREAPVAVAKEPEEDPWDEYDVASPPAKPRILVIDDDPAIGRLLRDFLEGEDVEIEFWTALKPVEEVSPDLCAIICDV